MRGWHKNCVGDSIMKKKILLGFWAFWGLSSVILGQNTARITGSLQSNANFFIRNEAIGAANTPQYDYQKFGAENWLNLNYSNWGFDVGMRFDVFNNSNLLNPLGSYNGEGIGRWYVQKKIGDLELAGGYLYDQIGSGIIFRAYEERALLIDQALYGIRVGYHLNDNWQIKGFTGRMKRQFSNYGTTLRGAVVEGFIKPDSTRSLTLAPGFGVVGRSYDAETVTQVVNTIAGYNPLDSIGAQYNTYAATVYNTLTAGPFTWYAEGATKTNDVLTDPFALQADRTAGKLVNRPGYTLYSSLSYAAKGLGVTLEWKRTRDFSFRNTPFQNTIQGPINFLPPMARQNTFRLPARFAPATQELGEQAVQLDARYKINKKVSLSFNFSDIRLLDGTSLYREIAPEMTFKKAKKWQLLTGIQLLQYNILVYQAKKDPVDTEDPLRALGGGKANYVDALTPYAEWLYKFSARRSLRIEAQYLLSDDEFGSWINAGAEYGAAHWVFFVSNMYKIPHRNPERYDAEKTRFDGIHYPNVGAAYTHRANRIALAYVKQVEGINCAGGICRYEPAFHGVRMNINSTF
jgi:hypothetical protein